MNVSRGTSRAAGKVVDSEQEICSSASTSTRVGAEDDRSTLLQSLSLLQSSNLSNRDINPQEFVNSHHSYDGYIFHKYAGGRQDMRWSPTFKYVVEL
jgi:hypothetical protein